MEWNAETIDRLRAFWSDGLSTAEIGRRMGVTKNAVVGKAHRLSLPARPSPIRRGVERAPRRVAPRRVSGPTLPALPTAAALPPEPPRAMPSLRVVTTPRNPGTAGSLRISPCCWPIGEPGTPSFRFCDADALGGKPYCDTHAAVAYVKVRDRREDAA